VGGPSDVFLSMNNSMKDLVNSFKSVRKMAEDIAHGVNKLVSGLVKLNDVLKNFQFPILSIARNAEIVATKGQTALGSAAARNLQLTAAPLANLNTSFNQMLDQMRKMRGGSGDIATNSEFAGVGEKVNEVNKILSHIYRAFEISIRPNSLQNLLNALANLSRKLILMTKTIITNLAKVIEENFTWIAGKLLSSGSYGFLIVLRKIRFFVSELFRITGKTKHKAPRASGGVVHQRERSAYLRQKSALADLGIVEEEEATAVDEEGEKEEREEEDLGELISPTAKIDVPGYKSELDSYLNADFLPNFDTSFKGLMEGARDTSKRIIEWGKETKNNLKQGVDEGIMAPIKKKGLKAAKAFGKTMKKTGKVMSSISKTQAFQRILAPFDAVKDTFMGLFDILSVAFVPIVNDLIGLITLLYPAVSGVATESHNWYESLKEWVSGLTWDDVVDWLKELPDTIMSWLLAIGPVFLEWIIGVVPQVLALFGQIWLKLLGFWIQLPIKIVIWLASLIPLLAGWIIGIGPQLIEWLGNLVVGIRNWFVDDFLPGLITVLGDSLGIVWEFIKDLPGIFIEKFEEGLKFW